MLCLYQLNEKMISLILFSPQTPQTKRMRRIRIGCLLSCTLTFFFFFSWIRLVFPYLCPLHAVFCDWNAVLRPFSTSKSYPARNVYNTIRLSLFLFTSLYLSQCTCACSVVSNSLRTPATHSPPWTVVHQAPLSTEFYRQEYWSGLPFASPGDRPNPGTEPVSCLSHSGRWILYPCTTWEALIFLKPISKIISSSFEDPQHSYL